MNEDEDEDEDDDASASGGGFWVLSLLLLRGTKPSSSIIAMDW